MAADHSLALAVAMYQPNHLDKMVVVEIILIRHDANGKLNRNVAATLAEWKKAKYQTRELFAGAVHLGDPMPPAPKKLPSRQSCRQQKQRAA